jgi:polyisoprenoid-binding protein YceI
MARFAAARGRYARGFQAMRTGLLALLLLLLPAVGVAKDWRFLPEASAVTVTFQQGSQTVDGRFETFTAEISFDPANLNESAVVVAVDLASFASGDDERDAQAAADSWLAARTRPHAIYRTLAFRAKGESVYEVDAELDLRGVTRRLTHDVRIMITGDRAVATGEVPLPRTDFGIGATADPNGSTVGLQVVVHFSVEAVAV